MKSSSGHLTVVGAGPKAVAIAAKHKVLGDLGLDVPVLQIVEPNEIGAHWTGKYGYTDGSLPLGTPPEKDVGFPYASAVFDEEKNRAINGAMLKYSWAAFHVLKPGRSYAEWIDRGRPCPQHKHWAEYLDWVASSLELCVTSAELSEIDVSDERWRLHLTTGETFHSDGLVITSPGPPKQTIEVKGESPWVFDGRDFWLQDARERLEERARSGDCLEACVIGTGETAAAISVQLSRLLPASSISVMSSEGIVYTRGESFEENRLYSEPERWRDFSLEVREDFVKRTDRGVFSVSNKDVLNQAQNVETIPGTVERIEPEGEKLVLELADGERSDRYDVVVDATGFCPDWFIDHMSRKAFERLKESLQSSLSHDPRLPFAHGKTTKGRLEILSKAIGFDLAIENLKPALHLPMLAGMTQGPGFPNLSCLGLLSDRILQRHCGSPPPARAASEGATVENTNED